MRKKQRSIFLLLLISLAASTIGATPASAELYSFTSHTFTPCAASGNSGPTLSACRTAYSSTSWRTQAALFDVLNGVQLWTVPATGRYRITVAGAAGGLGKQAGGKGATISGEFSLTQGAILRILVGQVGAGFASGSGGGGGGTFVTTYANSPLIVAGGGGGGGGNASATHFGRDATYLTSATASNSSGAGGTATAGGIGSTIAYGGGGGGSAAFGVHGGNQSGGGGGLGAAGGAGFGGDGGNGQNSFVVPKSFLNGGAGGYRTTHGTISDSFGGFGGGGNGTAITYESGGGGGGGYAGGGGGNGLQNGGGGGGGSSYNSGTNAQNINVTNSGAGTAAFVFLDADTTPPSITSGSSFSVSENSTTIATLTANETSTWIISAGVDSLTASIETNTGIFRFKVGQNFESPSDANADRSYLITVRATDEAGNSATSSLTVTLLDINEAPVINSNGGGSSASIAIAENSSSVTTLSAVDVDSVSTLSYSISGVDSSDFLVGTASGVLTFESAPNFESPMDADLNNIYQIVVAVSDGFLTDTQTLSITITDITDSASISDPTLSSLPNKGVSITLSYQLDTAGRATFYAAGKKIPGCISKSTSGSSPITATCNWKPANSGLISLSVMIRPSGSGVSATTSKTTTVQVGRRSGIR